MRLASFVGPILVLSSLPACTLWFGGDDGDDQCLAVPAAGGGAELAIQEQRNPADLTCASYGGYCDPACGPCPETAADFAPIPTYGYCGHICETYTETQCAADPECRVVLDADCTLGTNACLTNFMGCFPTDQTQNTAVDCWTADAWTCSQSNACTAYHSTASCPPGTDPAQCDARPFELCAPEGAAPGACGIAECDRTPPVCPQGTTPGVANGCYTNACIPTKYCLLD